MKFLKLIALAAVATSLALAQRDLGTITGTVTDQTSGVIANAKITIIEQATGVREQVTSDTSSIGNQQGNSNFGRIASTLPGSQRYVQFALRLMF